MKVFISGPMSGKPLYNAHAFYNAERLLKEFGFSVWNPAWQQYPDDTEFTRDDMHHIDNAALHMCDAIYMLEGWEESDGAKAEYELAKRFKKIIIHEAEFEKAKDIATNSVFGLTSAKFDSKPFKDFREEAAKKREALLEANLSHIMRQCNEFDEDIHELFDDMEDRKKDISEQDRRLDCHHNRLISLTERVDMLSKKCEELKVDTAYLKFKKKQHDNLTDVQNKNIEDNVQHIVNLEESRTRDWYELQQVRKDVTDLINSVRLGTTSNTDTIRELQDIYGGEIDTINKILYRHDETIRECQKALEDYTEAYKQLRTSLNNTDNALERRIKAIEKRLSIKPFYEPTEDEKDD